MDKSSNATKTGEANARQRTAAQVLLAAARLGADALNHYDDYTPDDRLAAFEALNAAINSAEERS